ncbi:23S rRNA (uracil(1939)-C(5))-methyltransferase RlmD [Alcaligenes endophyticus]|uniref:23S rRNA (uracil(1939)-C(5))-methyltransferase RlmD n=1 Tax=Alcaligenes endophyticus TaxID=1929088 RepID=A0ABT8EK26_9BURK|nr:23S rRNA (uracil(1939)-C(5))-methyltransferase RlmD [Alcaligenes endophyticus]MCX5591958.1 23S rRNA (uracil(1939)-C(5))-methyltransferase RlmD [Alcaligenes endophyticus]MDN4121648.1 23S rRNA (uracil(1939)-C(5))-methyltransferase RlmD [Alcaligenes endophyticus]
MSDVLLIESLDLEGRGVAHRDGKVVFVEGALPGERVRAQVVRSKDSYDKARMTQLLHASSMRVEPPCPNFSVCGGCAMQHLHPEAQVAVKQRVLEDTLEHIGGVQAPQILPPLHGPYWGYRFRARFSVRLVNKKGGVLVGFRERNGRYVVDMDECRVLPADVSQLLRPLRTMLGGLSRPDRIPQIELAKGDQQLALTLRHMEPLSAEDIELLSNFGREHQVTWYLQPKGPETIHPLNRGDEQHLAYALPEFDLRMGFKPSDFTQVNQSINRSMIHSALSLLQVQPEHRVADMFCGLGNFSLPIARQAANVVGVEGSSTLTLRATEAAREHGLQDKASFATLNLFEVDVSWLRELGYFDRMLIDPPRDGAMALSQALSQLDHHERPERLVYVSCNPGTLARDAGILVREGGWKLEQAGVINMFPHTAHIESIALFTR